MLNSEVAGVALDLWCNHINEECSSFNVVKSGDDEATIEKKMATYDKARRNYYNYHTSRKWGEYQNYDLAINSSLVGEEGACDIIINYVNAREKLADK